MGQLFGASEAVPVAATLSGASDHRALPRDDGVSAGAVRRRRSKAASTDTPAQPLVKTSDRSWAETDVQGLLTAKKIALDPGQGQAGTDYARRRRSRRRAARSARSHPTSREAPKPETRVVVFGDSDFASNSVLGIEGNRDIFMNTVGWLSQQENLISVRAEGARRSPPDADRHAAEQPHLAVAADRAGRDLRHRRLQLVAEAVGDARTEIDARAAGRPRRSRRATSTSCCAKKPDTTRHEAGKAVRRRSRRRRSTS